MRTTYCDVGECGLIVSPFSSSSSSGGAALERQLPAAIGGDVKDSALNRNLLQQASTCSAVSLPMPGSTGPGSSVVQMAQAPFVTYRSKRYACLSLQQDPVACPSVTVQSLAANGRGSGRRLRADATTLLPLCCSMDVDAVEIVISEYFSLSHLSLRDNFGVDGTIRRRAGGVDPCPNRSHACAAVRPPLQIPPALPRSRRRWSMAGCGAARMYCGPLQHQGAQPR